MKQILRSLLISLLSVGLLSLALNFGPRPATTATAAGKSPMRAVPAGDIFDILDRLHQTFTLDVACDGRTFRLDTRLDPDNDQNPFDPFDPNKLIQVKRGNTFIVDGKIYRGGTIPSGGDFDNPNSFGPDSPGDIGKWTCRGAFNFDFSEIAGGAAPTVFTTQVFQLNNDDALWTDGPEGGARAVRAVTGGTGRFSGARGQVTQEELGVNGAGESRAFNFRFTFKLKRF